MSVLGLQIGNVRQALAASYKYVAGEADILQNLDRSFCWAATPICVFSSHMNTKHLITTIL